MSKRRNKYVSDEELNAEIESWTEERRQETIRQSLRNSINIKCRSKTQKEVVEAIQDHDICIVTGPPGTGKTYLSCARALKYIKDEPATYKRIVLIKSVNVPKDEEIGYLKGTLEDKMELYVYPFISNFEKVIGKVALQALQSNGTIEILPIKFVMGTTLDNQIVIINESQNISKQNLVGILTRLGHNSKMIFLGDIKQRYQNIGGNNGLDWMVNKFKDFDDIGFAELSRKDIVRHPIIEKILDHIGDDPDF